jgi:hypothetical protein
LESVYGKSSDLHVPQTLARSYYINRQSTEERDLDQVVLKQCELNMQKSNEQNHAESQLGRLEKPRPTSGTITDAPQPASPEGDGKTASFIYPQIPQAKPEADRKQEQEAPDWKPIVSLLMVHHLWLWKIDNRKYKESFFSQ